MRYRVHDSVSSSRFGKHSLCHAVPRALSRNAAMGEIVPVARGVARGVGLAVGWIAVGWIAVGWILCGDIETYCEREEENLQQVVAV